MSGVRILLRPRYRSNWIIGRRKSDGFTWYVRGTNFPISHEDWLRALVHPFSGEMFVDIGAHIGTWAVRATKTFRRVVAFEPSPQASKILRTTVSLNRLKNIAVIEAAISSHLSDSRRVRTGVSMRESESGYREYTLDSFGFKPSLVKIDTEGNELRVLQGAVETLLGKPQLVIETHGPEAVEPIRTFLNSYEYSVEEVRRINRFNQLQSWLLCN